MDFDIELLKETCGDLSLLFAEDDPDILASTGKLFSRIFGRVTTATNGRQALDHYHSASFDLVITDLEMPVMNGLELIREIRQNRREQAIIVLSGCSDIQLLLQLLDQQLCGFLAKPAYFSEISRVLARACADIREKKALDLYVRELETASFSTPGNRGKNHG